MTKAPIDVTLWNSGDASLSALMRAMLHNGAHFTDSFRFAPGLGRGISVDFRVQVPEGKRASFTEALGNRGEVRDPPRVQINAATAPKTEGEKHE